MGALCVRVSLPVYIVHIVRFTSQLELSRVIHELNKMAQKLWLAGEADWQPELEVSEVM